MVIDLHEIGKRSRIWALEFKIEEFKRFLAGTHTTGTSVSLM
jgi:hypothetical protein